MKKKKSEREEGVKSVLRNVSGQASGCTAQMTVRESLAGGSREPRSTPPALWLPPLSLPSFPFRRLCLWHRRQPACLPPKTLRNRGGAVTGKRADVRLAEHGNQQNPFLCVFAARGQSAARSLPSSARAHSAVSTLNSGKPPDSQLKQQSHTD